LGSQSGRKTLRNKNSAKYSYALLRYVWKTYLYC
jgi:hypothetical protein